MWKQYEDLKFSWDPKAPSDVPVLIGRTQIGDEVIITGNKFLLEKLFEKGNIRIRTTV